MAPGKPCKHCTVAGCAIYEQRPEDPCVKFVCGWLQPDSLLPENMRPDQAGVIVMYDRNWERWPVIRAIPTGPQVPPESLRWLQAHAEETRKPLIFVEYEIENGRLVKFKRFGFGPPAFREAVQTTIEPHDIIKI